VAGEGSLWSVFFNESFIVDNTQILPYFLNLDLQNWVPFNWRRSTMSGFHAVPPPLQIGIWSVGFCGGRKTEYQRVLMYLVMREPTTNATHIWQQARIEPGSHWWEVSTLTTAPSLLLKKCDWFSVNQRNTNHSTPRGSKQTNLFLITKERRSTLWIPPNTKFLLTTSISL